MAGSESRRRPRQINCRVSVLEHAVLLARVSECGMTLGEYIRMCLRREVLDDAAPGDLKAIAAECERLGP